MIRVLTIEQTPGFGRPVDSVPAAVIVVPIAASLR
jgi:hypothetical protein